LFDAVPAKLANNIVPNATHSVWYIVDELLCYRGAGALGCPDSVDENERYREDPSDGALLSSVDESELFKFPQMRQALKTDFINGDLVAATPKQSGVHPWVLAREFRIDEANAFSSFYGQVDGTYAVGGNLILHQLSLYALFSSVFFNAEEHWTYIKRIVTFGAGATNANEFSEFLTEQLQLLCLQLRYLNTPTEKRSALTVEGLSSEVNFAAILTAEGLPGPIWSLTRISIEGFEGTTRNEDFGAWIAAEDRLRKVQEELAKFPQAPPVLTGEDFGVSVLDWLRKRVFASVEAGHFFNRDLEWFFNIKECLLVRQLYAVLAEGSTEIPDVSGRPWKVLTWLLEPYWKGDLTSPDPRLSARLFWNRFRDAVLGADGSDPIECIGASAKKAFDSIAETLRLRECIPWTIVGTNVQFIEGKLSETVITFPSLIDRLVYSVAMFHPGGVLGPTDVSNLGNFFGFLRALPRVRFTECLPAISDLASLLKVAFARQFNLAYVLLRLCSKCKDLTKELQFLSKIGFCLISPERMESLNRAFETVDACIEGPGNAYERLKEFTRAAVAVHNDALFNSQVGRVSFASVKRSDVFPHMNVDNTLLQVMVKDYSQFSVLDFFGVSLKIVKDLVDPGEGFLGGEADDVHWQCPKCIAFYEDGADIFGFDESIFRTSLKQVQTTTGNLEKLWASIPDANERDGEVWAPLNDEAGVMLALATLEEFKDQGPKDLTHLLKAECEKRTGKERRRWAFLRAILDEPSIGEADEGAESYWSSGFIDKLVSLIDAIKAVRSPNG
jgi:hypothetical protein